MGRLADARKRYVRNPTRATLRAYLILKARTGRWDDRYCRWYNVSPNVNDGCKGFITRGYARGLVPTSTLRFPVSAFSSYHQRRNVFGAGMGVDMGLIARHIGTRYGRDKMVGFQRAEEAAFRRGERRRMLELIGPDNKAIVLRGNRTDLVEGVPLEQQHDDHVHGAFSG